MLELHGITLHLCAALLHNTIVGGHGHHTLTVTYDISREMIGCFPLFSDPNVALNKPAFQSYSYYGAGPSRAVDGNT